MPQTLMKTPISAPSLALLGSSTLAVVLSQIRTCTPHRSVLSPFVGPNSTRGCYGTVLQGGLRGQLWQLSGVEEDREPPGGEGGKATGCPHRGEVCAALAMRCAIRCAMRAKRLGLRAGCCSSVVT